MSRTKRNLLVGGIAVASIIVFVSINSHLQEPMANLEQKLAEIDRIVIEKFGFTSASIMEVSETVHTNRFDENSKPSEPVSSNPLDSVSQACVLQNGDRKLRIEIIKMPERNISLKILPTRSCLDAALYYSHLVKAKLPGVAVQIQAPE